MCSRDTCRCVCSISVKHSGNLSFEDIMKIAKQMRERSMAKNLTGTVKEVLGKNLEPGATKPIQSFC